MIEKLGNQRTRAMAGCALLVIVAATPYVQARPRPNGQGFGHSIRHVLLISIDGMHAVDFINCANGISGANNEEPYCPNLAALKAHGINYLYTSTSRPSDSFPGLMALSREALRAAWALSTMSPMTAHSIRQRLRPEMA
jgi:hypothetical protein